MSLLLRVSRCPQSRILSQSHLQAKQAISVYPKNRACFSFFISFPLQSFISVLFLLCGGLVIKFENGRCFHLLFSVSSFSLPACSSHCSTRSSSSGRMCHRFARGTVPSIKFPFNFHQQS